jgi:hypothetical protein
MRDSLAETMGKGFFSLGRIQVKADVEIIGECNVTNVPCRLTVYEVSKAAGGGRELRVVATGYHDKPEKASFRTKLPNLEEHVFFVTAEKVASRDELNSHLQYMDSQGNTIALKGYGTNWNLSQLKLKMAGKTPGAEQKEDEFEKDGQWLIKQLIRPIWVMSIRVEAQ